MYAKRPDHLYHLPILPTILPGKSKSSQPFRRHPSKQEYIHQSTWFQEYIMVHPSNCNKIIAQTKASLLNLARTMHLHSALSYIFKRFKVKTNTFWHVTIPIPSLALTFDQENGVKTTPLKPRLMRLFGTSLSANRTPPQWCPNPTGTGWHMAALKQGNWAVIKTLVTFYYSGWWIGILLSASYNPYIAG